MSSRQRVLRAVVAIADHTERCMGGAQPVRAFHVRYFGIPECVTDLTIGTINTHLRTLMHQGLIVRPDRWTAEYLPSKSGEAASEWQS